jgi:hypothetical protein
VLGYDGNVGDWPPGNKYNFPGIDIYARGGCQARSKALDLGSSLAGVQGFESLSPHCHFVQTSHRQALSRDVCLSRLSSRASILRRLIADARTRSARPRFVTAACIAG